MNDTIKKEKKSLVKKIPFQMTKRKRVQMFYFKVIIVRLNLRRLDALQ